MTIRIFLVAFLINLNLSAQDKAAYKIFLQDGKLTNYAAMVKDLAKADVVLFGEMHDNAIAHWLELQIAKDIYEQRKDLTLGMEMFEADDQIVLDEYLSGDIEEKHLLSEAKVWDNYKNDYKPLIEFAKEKKLRVVATNVPRRYANLVYRKGIKVLDSLDTQALQWIAPLPVNIDLSLPGYKEMMTSMGGHGSAESTENLARSQALKDATMAHFILKNRKGVVLHFNGAYHSQNFDGIVWYLKKAYPALKIMTVHTAEQETIDTLDEDNKNKADFIICVPADMTKTY